jgi:hypothetical protein
MKQKRVNKIEPDELSSKSGNRIPVIIDGISYDSIADASRQLGVTRATIEGYIRNASKRNTSSTGGIRKAVVAVLIVITLAVIALVALVWSSQQHESADSTAFEKATVSSSSIEKDKGHYFDVPKTDLQMTFKTFRENLTAQGVELTKISWRLFPEKTAYGTGYEGINTPNFFDNLATDATSLNNLDANWCDKETGESYDQRPIFRIFQVNNGVREDVAGKQHIEWSQHQIEVWLSKDTKEIEPTSYNVEDILVKKLPLKYDGWSNTKPQGIGGVDLSEVTPLKNIRRDEMIDNDFGQLLFRVIPDKLYIRSKPDINSEIVGHVIKDDVIWGYLGEANGNFWVLVNIVDTNTKGYILLFDKENKSQYLSFYLGRIKGE